MRSHLNLGISKPEEVSDDTVKAVADTLKNSNFLKVSEDDPYLNTDAGTMSPFDHGQVFVLDDGGEWVGLLFSCYCWKFRPLEFSAGRFEEETEKSLREGRKDGHWIHFLERLALSTSCDELSWNWYHEDDSQR
ncbi:hypothetical protein ACSBR1_019969 [Camellia fascicularis]